MRRALVIAALLGGCYDPTITEHLPCAADLTCPDGLTCQAGPLVCVTDIPDNANFRLMSAGTHTCGITPENELYCWGPNERGQLGIDAGTGDPVARPTRVGADADWRTVAVGDSYTVAIRNDGTLWGWGDGQYFEDDVTSLSPRMIAGAGYQDVIAGFGTWCAIDDSGTPLCRERQAAPAIDPGSGWDRVVGAGGHYCGIKGGDLFCWGANNRGQCGDGTTDAVTTPTEIGTEHTWQTVVVGVEHSCAIDETAMVWCWGSNVLGQSGQQSLGMAYTVPTPLSLPDGRTAKGLQSGWNTTCVIANDDNAVCFGAGERGQVGDAFGDIANAVPRLVRLNQYASITTGLAHACGLDLSNQAWCWGNDDNGQLGDGAVGHDVEPTPLDGHRIWRSLSVGERHACAIDGSGLAACWGHGGRGQLGDGAALPRVVPSPVIDETGEGWLDISVGLDHTCALRPDHTLWCWGDATRGELGFGPGAQDRSAPAKLDDREYSEVVAVEGGGCAIAEGDLYCWGGARGAIPTPVEAGGDWSALVRGVEAKVCGRQSGTLKCWRLLDASDPVPEPGEPLWARFAVGTTHTCGLFDDPPSAITCTGSDTEGEKGDGTPSTAGEAGPDMVGWARVAAGDHFTCAIAADDGALWCWGRNGLGQHGDGMRTQSTAPVRAVGDHAWSEIAASGNTACAIEADEESIYCWGVDNGFNGGWDSPAAVVRSL